MKCSVKSFQEGSNVSSLMDEAKKRNLTYREYTPEGGETSLESRSKFTHNSHLLDFVTLGLKILRFFRLNVEFEADVTKG